MPSSGTLSYLAGDPDEVTPTVFRRPPRLLRCMLLALSVLWTAPLAGQQSRNDHGSLVIVVGQEGSLPIPTLISGRANGDVADLLFLRLAALGPTLRTAGDEGFEPRLAARWERRDSVTLVFDLDPRARWHDGTPVTARDVVFSFGRFRDPKVSPKDALILRWITSVTAESQRRVVIRFSRVYGEQLYDAIFHVQPLPAHLVDTIPPERLAASAFARAPVGNGAYRWGRRDPGRLVELTADPQFFLGTPKLDRVVFLTARDPQAQLNLLLDGTADAHQGVDPVAGLPRLRSRRDLVTQPVASLSVGYLLFNMKSYGNRSRPHPILADAEVRQAIAMGLDRRTLVRAAMGNFGVVAEGPVAQAHWIRESGPSALPYNPARARRLLRDRGWTDNDGDGYLEKAGQPLTLRLNYPGPNAVRNTMAPLVQDQLRRIGVRIEIIKLDGPVWIERRDAGEFDIDFSQAAMDPTPSGLTQSWTCAAIGGANVGGYCNPGADSMIDRAIAAATPDRDLWHQIIRTIVTDAPAVFVYAPTMAMVLHRRYKNVSVRTTSYWADVWKWSVKPGQQITRDRGATPE